MVHAGYEASAVLGGNKKLGDTWKMLHWTFSGKMGGLLGGKGKAAPIQRKGNGHNGEGHGPRNGNGSHAHTAVFPPGSVSPKEDEVFRIL